MSTEFGEKLQKAMDKIESLTWRDKNGHDVKLIEASEDNLNK